MHSINDYLRRIVGTLYAPGDSVNDMLRKLSSAVSNQRGGVLFTSSAIKNLGASSGSIVPTGVGSMVIPANSVVSGSRYRISAICKFNNLETGDMNFLVYIGASEVAGASVSFNTVANVSLNFVVDISFLSAGAGGTCVVGISLAPQNGVQTIFLGNLIVPATVNTTQAQTVDLRIQWDGPETSTTHCSILTFEKLL
ncbi:MAG TPA: hypothetical protein VEH04_16830 [Verrucomicrobiae bacterium]|nr:hypothetical protein [Verrucomicrobiae bacterium]